MQLRIAPLAVAIILSISATLKVDAVDRVSRQCPVSSSGKRLRLPVPQVSASSDVSEQLIDLLLYFETPKDAEEECTQAKDAGRQQPELRPAAHEKRRGREAYRHLASTLVSDGYAKSSDEALFQLLEAMPGFKAMLSSRNGHKYTSSKEARDEAFSIIEGIEASGVPIADLTAKEGAEYAEAKQILAALEAGSIVQRRARLLHHYHRDYHLPLAQALQLANTSLSKHRYQGKPTDPATPSTIIFDALEDKTDRLARFRREQKLRRRIRTQEALARFAKLQDATRRKGLKFGHLMDSDGNLPSDPLTETLSGAQEESGASAESEHAPETRGTATRQIESSPAIIVAGEDVHQAPLGPPASPDEVMKQHLKGWRTPRDGMHPQSPSKSP